MTKYITTLLLLFVSVVAFALVDSTLVDSVKMEIEFYDTIDQDPRYMELCDKHSLLLDNEDSLRILIAEARDSSLLYLTIPQLSTVHVCVLSCFRRV